MVPPVFDQAWGTLARRTVIRSNGQDRRAVPRFSRQDRHIQDRREGATGPAAGHGSATGLSRPAGRGLEAGPFWTTDEHILATPHARTGDSDTRRAPNVSGLFHAPVDSRPASAVRHPVHPLTPK